MSKNNILSKLILDYKNSDLIHVFLIVNPVTVIIARLIIDLYKINKNRILIISFRDTDLQLLNFKYLKIKSKKTHRFHEKLFFQSPKAKRILKELNNKNFIVYSSWANRELNSMMKAKNCLGHFYIEEGQGTYFNHTPFSYKDISLKQKILNNWKNRVTDTPEKSFFYRNDALGYFGISDESFPMAPIEKKIILSNIKTLAKYYRPQLRGIKTIGLTCAERRLKDNDLKKMLKILVEKLPNNSAIKAHPSLTFTKERFNRLKNNLAQVNNKQISLCNNDIIIELEMLYEKKILIGPQTSLSRYAKLLNSRFEYIKLY